MTEKNEAVEFDPTNRYCRYNELLGSGSYKSVFRGFDQEMGIEVAWNQVKTSKIPVSEKKTLFEEVTLLKHLRHDNIIECYHNWEDPSKDEVIFITELMSSGTLKSFITKTSPVNIKVVKNWCRQILSALQYLHTEAERAPIIHRDLKCDNIFVNGNIGQLKIGDLGLSTSLRNTYAQSVIGTPEFMAPELYEENYNEKVDIYAFGMCVLEMVTNQYPYNECENAAQIYKKVTKGLLPDALVKLDDGEVKCFIMECLAPEAQRPSARELLAHKFLLASEEDAKTVKHTPKLLTPLATATPTSLDITASTSASGTPSEKEKSTTGGNVSELLTEAELFESSRVIGRAGSNVAHFQIFGQIKGEKKVIKFEFDVVKDDSRKVAEEMIAEVAGLDRYNVELLDRVICDLIRKFKFKYGEGQTESSDEPRKSLVNGIDGNIRSGSSSSNASTVSSLLPAVASETEPQVPSVTPLDSANLDEPSHPEKLSPQQQQQTTVAVSEPVDEDERENIYKQALMQFVEKNMPSDANTATQHSVFGQPTSQFSSKIVLEREGGGVADRTRTADSACETQKEDEDEGDSKYETAYNQFLQNMSSEVIEQQPSATPVLPQGQPFPSSQTDQPATQQSKSIAQQHPIVPRPQQPPPPQQAQPQQQQSGFSSALPASNSAPEIPQQFPQQQQSPPNQPSDGMQQNVAVQHTSSTFFVSQPQQSQQLPMNPVIYMTPQFQQNPSNQMIYMPPQQQQMFLSSQYQNQPPQLIYVLQSQQPHIFSQTVPVSEPTTPQNSVMQQPQIVTIVSGTADSARNSIDLDEMERSRIAEGSKARSIEEETKARLEEEATRAKAAKDEEVATAERIRVEEDLRVAADKLRVEEEEARTRADRERTEDEVKGAAERLRVEEEAKAVQKESAALEEEEPKLAAEDKPRPEEAPPLLVATAVATEIVTAAAPKSSEEETGQDGEETEGNESQLAVGLSVIPSATVDSTPRVEAGPSADVGRRSPVPTDSRDQLQLPAFRVSPNGSIDQEMIRLNRQFLQYQQLLCDWQRNAFVDIMRTCGDLATKPTNRRSTRVSPVNRKTAQSSESRGFVPVPASTALGSTVGVDSNAESSSIKMNGVGIPNGKASLKPKTKVNETVPTPKATTAANLDEKATPVVTDSEEEVGKQAIAAKSSAVDEKIASVLHNLDMSMSSKKERSLSVGAALALGPSAPNPQGMATILTPVSASMNADKNRAVVGFSAK